VRAALVDPAEEVRAAAAWAAGELRCRGAEPELTAILERGVDRVAGNAAWAAGEIRARRAIPALRRRLSEGGPAVRANAALALASLGDGRAGEIIRRRLRQERSLAVRAAMIDALGRLGDPASLTLLEELTSLEGLAGQLAHDALTALSQGRSLPALRGAETFRTRLIDDNGDPMVGVWFTLALPDRRMLVGVSDLAGEITQPNLPEGDCTLGIGRTP
jgi:HEAT repeat protein